MELIHTGVVNLQILYCKFVMLVYELTVVSFTAVQSSMFTTRGA